MDNNMKQRRFYDTAVKKEIILYAEEHGNRAAGRAFDISESCIRLWRKHKAEIFSPTAEPKIVITGPVQTWSVPAAKRKVVITGPVRSWYDQIEEALCAFINEQKENGNIIPLELVQLRAHDIAMSLNIPLAQFEATCTWLKRFIIQKSFSIHCKVSAVNKMSDEFEKKLMKYRQFIVHLRKQNTYPLSQIGNANEIPVFLDLPSASNKGFTVMLCVTADGAKLPPYVIFKCENVLKKNFPEDIIVQTQENGCMTPELMLDWYKTVWCSRPGAELNPRAMLTLDSSMSHLLTEDWLTGGNTDLVVVPNGMACLPQPVDIYINKAFKEMFRHQCEKWLLSKGRLKSASPSLLSHWISAAWKEVSVEVIVKSFKKCYLSNALDGAEDDLFSTSEDEYIVASYEFQRPSAPELVTCEGVEKDLSEDDVGIFKEDSDLETPASSCSGVQPTVSGQNEQLIPLTFSVVESGVEFVRSWIKPLLYQ
ncbi:hypothetical protein B7P43_G15027, partial [Cryptotermes secundus]